MEKVYEDVGLCPVCGKNTFHVTLYRYNLPVEGPSIIFVGRCTSCGARVADVIPLETGKEVVLKFQTTPENLKRILFIPGDTEIELPELGVDVRLTPAFKGRITTLEGVIRMIEEDVPSEEIKSALREAAEGKKNVTVVIRNRTGLLKEIKI